MIHFSRWIRTSQRRDYCANSTQGSYLSLVFFTCLHVHLLTLSLASHLTTSTYPDLDRSNLGNARLQGMPEDVLGGDPTGVLFDWLVSIFFIPYVSPMATCLSLVYSQCLRLDPVPGTMDNTFQVLRSSNMDWLFSHLMGPMLYTDGE